MQKLISVTDLVNQGISRKTVYQMAHMKNAPIFRTGKKNKIYFLADELDDFMVHANKLLQKGR